jgi:autotransporter-associated beta strand protein
MHQVKGGRACAAKRVCGRGGFWCGVMLIAALAAPSAADASTYRWQVDASGNWNVPGNWELVEGAAGAGYPNLPGDVAVFDEPLTAVRTVIIPDTVTITIGRLTVAGAPDSARVAIARVGTGLLVFDNLGEDAVIESSGEVQFISLATPIELAADLVVNGVFQFLRLSEAGGSRNVTITGQVDLMQPNTYTGTTTLTDGVLSTSSTASGARIPGALVVGDGVGAASTAYVTFVGSSIENSDVQVNADGRLSFANNPALGSFGNEVHGLTVAGGKVDISTSPCVLNVHNITMEGGEVLLENSQNTLMLFGTITATSNAAAPAVIRTSTPAQPGFLLLTPPTTHDFTIADGPHATDFSVEGIVIAETTPGIGVSKRGPGVMHTSGPNSYTGTTTIVAGTLQVNGSQPSSAVQVDAAGTLTGVGTVGPVTVASNGTLTPGVPVGALKSGSVAFVPDARFNIEIHGALSPAGPGNNRLAVTGTVDLNGASLGLTAATALPKDAIFTIIENDGNDPVAGTFAGMPEGKAIWLTNTSRFRISYQGGDGNDVVLVNESLVEYFLSEGATGSFFDEDVVIANPNSEDAPVQLAFLEQGDIPVGQQLIVRALSRLTVSLDQIPGLENGSSSVVVSSEARLPLAVERTMFWDAAHYGGHTANAVTRTERQWLFGEGAQSTFFDTYLLLGNPNTMSTDATVTFLRENEAPFVTTVRVTGRERVTVHAGAYPELAGRSFGMQVETDVPIIAERAMYFASTPTRLWSGGTGNAGNPAPSTRWFHAEGASGTFFNTFILVSNPQTTPANVTLRFLLQDGTPVELTKTIAPQGRLTLNPAAEGEPRLTNAAFSTVVTSDVPVVSERAMYWPTDVPFGEGHASSGVVNPALSWALAEGRVGGPNAYTTYILLANPNTQAADVTVTFLRESGEPVVKTYNVPGNTRFNVDVGGMVPELQNESFGVSVTVTNDVPIAVERSIYWNVDGIFWQGGTNALGTVIP